MPLFGQPPAVTCSPRTRPENHGSPPGLTGPHSPGRAAVLRVEAGSSTPSLGAPHTGCPAEGSPLVASPVVLGLHIPAGLGTDQRELMRPWKSFIHSSTGSALRGSSTAKAARGDRQQICRFLPEGFVSVCQHRQNMGTNSWNVSKDISSYGFKEFTRIWTG